MELDFIQKCGGIIMIEEMLMDIAGQGYSPENIKGAVIKCCNRFLIIVNL